MEDGENYCCMFIRVCVCFQYDEEGEEADDEVSVFIVHYKQWTVDERAQ